MGLVVAAFSGFYGDRRDVLGRWLESDLPDVLVGDYLAEVTLAILARQKQRDPALGYCQGFVRQLDQVWDRWRERGVPIVCNAGGLNPEACADAVLRVARERGDTPPRVAVVDGMNVVDALLRGELRVDTAGDVFPLERLRAANVYCGGRGIAAALREGAELVITGRVADSSLVVGPAVAHYGWAWDDWDRLAAAALAGHLIECGPQATGGNYSFYTDVDFSRPLGYPAVEIEADGQFVVFREPESGGYVSIGTVTAQALYEITGPRYRTPDVTVRFDSFRLESLDSRRVRIHSVRGEPAPERLKVSVHLDAGWRNHVMVGLGPDLDGRKREIFESQFWAAAGGRERFRETAVDAWQATDGSLLLRLAVADDDREGVGRAFADAAVGLALASVPGITFAAPPADASPCIETRSAWVSRDKVRERVRYPDGREEIVDNRIGGAESVSAVCSGGPRLQVVEGEMIDVPLGRLAGARSGDKGGDANLGIWTDSRARFDWLVHTLSTDRLRSLLPRPFEGPIRRYLFENLLAINFVLEGYLGRGAFANVAFDNQAKLLAEQIRIRKILAPKQLIEPVRQES